MNIVTIETADIAENGTITIDIPSVTLPEPLLTAAAVPQDAPRARRVAPVGVERRTVVVSGLRAETTDDGTYLVGYAANYNVLSSDLGWFRERLIPGAFKRAVDEKQDVYHLVNHDPSQILGRTTSGTTTLTDDEKGLAFRTLINKDDHHAMAFATRVARGDIDQCSFGFICRGQTWVTDRDPDNPKQTCDVREVTDLDLFDVSTVTYPAYPQTHTALAALRSAGDSVPAEIRDRVLARIKAAAVEPRDMTDNPDACECQCLACLDGECDDCDNEMCQDMNCMCDNNRTAPAVETREAKTKKVDGEDLSAECFIIVRDADDPSTWKLPWKFSTDEKTKTHLRNALARFNQMKNVDEETKKAAWAKLVRLCKDHGIDVAGEENKAIRARLLPDQVADLDFDAAAAALHIRMLEIETSL